MVAVPLLRKAVKTIKKNSRFPHKGNGYPLRIYSGCPPRQRGTSVVWTCLPHRFRV